MHFGIAMQAAPAAPPGGAPRRMTPMSNGKSKDADGLLLRVRFVVRVRCVVGEAGREG